MDNVFDRTDLATETKTIFNCFDVSGACGTVCDSVVWGSGASKLSTAVLAFGGPDSFTGAITVV